MEQPSGKKTWRFKIRPFLPYAPSVIAGMTLLCCLTYISTLSGDPKLQITGQVPGLAADAEAYRVGIQEVFEQSVANRSKLLIDTDKLSTKISSEYPELGEVTVALPLIGRRPVVHARLAAPRVIITNAEGGYVIDVTGRIMSKATNIESSVRDSLPVIQDESGIELEQGSYAMSTEAVAFINEVATQLALKKYNIQSMVLPPVANEMHVRLEGVPYYIKFNLRGEGRAQAGTYIATERKLTQDGVVPRAYVDVRVPGRVYYK